MMNVKVTISILGLLLVLVSLNGCVDFLLDDDENEIEKIPVSLYISATVLNSRGEPVPGVELQFDFSKTYGESYRAYRTTDNNGRAVVNQYSYNLYREHKITARCLVTAHSMMNEKTATFNQFLADMQTHDTTTWYESFLFTLDR